MASLPAPVEGLVVRYEYLWARERDAGRVSSKDRPACVMVVSSTQAGTGSRRVYLAPITHSEPAPGAPALALPADEKRRLGLDDRPSWLILSEVNVDIWPEGLAGAHGAENGVYGRLSHPLYRRAAERLAAEVRAGTVRRIPRP